MDIYNFIFNNLEVIVTIFGGIGTFYFIKSTKNKKSNNDLTPYIMKHKKKNESINKKSKTIF